VARWLLAAFQVASTWDNQFRWTSFCGTSRLLLNSDAPAKPKIIRPSRISQIYFISKPGCGKWCLATELAVYLQSETSSSVKLVNELYSPKFGEDL